MDTAEKQVSKTKLLVIDTQTRVARSFEGTYECGKAHLPDPNDEGDYTAAELTAQLNEFLAAADGAQYRASAEAERKAELGKKLVDLTKEYDGWFSRLVRKSPV